MNYDGKNIAILGLGITGKAVLKFLYNKQVKLTVYEDSAKDNVDKDILKNYPNCTYYFNGEKDILNNEDLLVVSPGVKSTHPLYADAILRSIPVKNDINLFLDEWEERGPIVGVTGSNGKSTIVSLLYDVISKSGNKVLLGGNIGESPLEYLEKEINHGTIIILELSNYQLELFNHDYFVDIAIISNITDNHLDRYDDGIEGYVKAKLNIIKEGHTKVIVDFDNPGIKKYILPKIGKRDVSFISLKEDIDIINHKGIYLTNDNLVIKDGEEITTIFKNVSNRNLIGEHNLYNIACSIGVLNLLDIDLNSNVEKLIREFKGLEHRIEFVKEIDGVKYINDSKSTSPDALAKALDSVASPKRVVLISGGDSKGVEYYSIKDYFNQFVKYLILLPGDANKKLIKIAQEFDIDFREVSSMKEAVSISKEVSVSGDTVLLSPGTSSLNIFKGFEDRGEKFKVELK